MPSKELRRWIDFLHEEKSQDSYFCARPREYHGSQLNPNHCINARWRDCMGATKEGRHSDLSLKTKIRMAMGELVHKEIQRALGSDYQAEVVAKIPVLDFQIVCRADLVGPDEVVDIKTWSRKKPLPTKPEPSHVYQLNTYLYAFSKKKGRLWYISYGEGDDVFFEVKYDPKMMRDVIAFTTLLDWFVTRGQEPEHKVGCHCCKKGE